MDILQASAQTAIRLQDGCRHILIIFLKIQGIASLAIARTSPSPITAGNAQHVTNREIGVFLTVQD
jgi:hypothetical protein